MDGMDFGTIVVGIIGMLAVLVIWGAIAVAYQIIRQLLS